MTLTKEQLIYKISVLSEGWTHQDIATAVGRRSEYTPDRPAVSHALRGAAKYEYLLPAIASIFLDGEWRREVTVTYTNEEA